MTEHMVFLDHILVIDTRGQASPHLPILAELSDKVHAAASIADAMVLFSYHSIDLVVVCQTLGLHDQISAIRNTRKQMDTADIVGLISAENAHHVSDLISAGVTSYLILEDDQTAFSLLPTMVQNLAQRRDKLVDRHQHKLQRLENLNQQLTQLTKINQELTKIYDSGRLIRLLMRKALDVLDAEGCSLWMWKGENKRTLVCRSVLHRADTPALVGMHVPVGTGIVGWVAKYSESVLLTSVDKDNRFNRKIDFQIDFETDSIIAVPLKMNDEMLGVMEFVNKRSGLFSEQDKDAAETLASTAAVAIQNARQVEQLRLYTVQLEERNEELDAFGHTLAHDLQNILSRLVGFSEVLAAEFEQPVPLMPNEQVEMISKKIAKNARKMSEVIDGLLLMAHVRNEDIQFSRLDMHYIIEETLHRLADEIKTYEATINVPETWPHAAGYAPWIEEIWVNYITNALKYGGRPPEVTLGSDVDTRTNTVHFWVEDNGVGIDDPSAYNQLFIPFNRRSLDHSVKGHGLGLSIVSRIVKRLGGTVSGERLPSGGSRFTFSLPADVDEHALVTPVAQFPLSADPLLN